MTNSYKLRIHTPMWITDECEVYAEDLPDPLPTGFSVVDWLKDNAERLWSEDPEPTSSQGDQVETAKKELEILDDDGNVLYSGSLE